MLESWRRLSLVRRRQGSAIGTDCGRIDGGEDPRESVDGRRVQRRGCSGPLRCKLGCRRHSSGENGRKQPTALGARVSPSICRLEHGRKTSGWGSRENACGREAK